MVSQLEKFSIELFQTIETSGNMCISPFSVAVLLSMTHAGAKGNTVKELEEALGFQDCSEQEIRTAFGDLIKSMKGNEEDYVLKSANLCYISEDFQIREEFQTILEENFEASVEGVNFDDPETFTNINNFVEEFTNHKIKGLLSKGASDPLMILVNAVYFKGDWLEPFDPELTQIQPFYLGSKESKVDVSMMSLTGAFRTGKIKSIDAKFVELPYKGKQLSMVIILPNEVDGLEKLEASLSGRTMDKMEKKASWKEICVKIPKFSIETETNLVDTLSELGINDLFSGRADLSGVSSLPGLFVSKIGQKCFIEIDEKGTEAAAATSGEVASSIPQSFKVDHPAIFILKDNVTKLILFMGRLTNPAQ